MIELLDVKKHYKSKDGVLTEALKGVSIKFPQKGLVFLLGKSGSGKSTLLNILGGLDTCTSGEVIINGKSTTDFKEKDWDAYRNSYIGFVFQEFNLLENYSVEENIKLALKLQHENISHSEILKVLKEVGLDDVLKRKPNELSGGQKQRIAIARALVKKPEVILADEPTGNLDSETSNQVFEILKKMSKNKLIIVVSHDEESASRYADRIIKISDGVVMSDNKEEVKDNAKQLKLKNAKLPMHYSLKMGIENLLHKKIKLAFSIVLMTLCLICFGIMLAFNNFDITKTYVDSFEKTGSIEYWIVKYNDIYNSEQEFLNVFKELFVSTSEEDESIYTVYMDDSDVDEIEEKTGLNWTVEYIINNNSWPLNWIFYDSVSLSDNVYNYSVYYDIVTETRFVIYEDELFNNYNIIGTTPQNNDEIVISSFIADQIIKYGVYSKTAKTDSVTQKYKPNNYEELVNDDIYINLGTMLDVKIVGIVDYSDYLEKYDELKEMTILSYFDNYDNEYIVNLNGDLLNDVYYELSRIYVNESFINLMSSNEENTSNTPTTVYFNNTIYYIDEFAYFLNQTTIYTDENVAQISSLNVDEIIINTHLLNEITDNDYYLKLEEYLDNNPSANQEDFLINYLRDSDVIGSEIGTSIKDDNIYNDYVNFAQRKIVGVVIDDKEYSTTYFNKEEIANLITDTLVINKVFKTVDDITEFTNILEIYPLDNGQIVSSSVLSLNIISSGGLGIILRELAKYGVIIFLILSVLLLINYISNSITFRKKEIGILRAIGCRSGDVIKMFIYEILALMLICLLIALPIVSFIASSVNQMIMDILSMEIAIADFGINSVLLLVVLVIILSILITLLSIREVINLKPIDAILGRDTRRTISE